MCTSRKIWDARSDKNKSAHRDFVNSRKETSGESAEKKRR